MPRIAPLALLLIALLAGATVSYAVEYSVVPGGNNLVRFVSKAVGETFDGTTSQISGSFSCNPDDLSAPVSGELSIPVETLDTGIKLRNQHMLKNHLHPGKYPEMTFTLESIKDAPASLPVGETVTFTGVGSFTCHGVTNDLEPTIHVTRTNTGSLSIKAEWTITLADYNIERPQFLVVKLAEEQEVTAEFSALPN